MFVGLVVSLSGCLSVCRFGGLVVNLTVSDRRHWHEKRPATTAAKWPFVAGSIIQIIDYLRITPPKNISSG